MDYDAVSSTLYCSSALLMRILIGSLGAVLDIKGIIVFHGSSFMPDSVCNYAAGNFFFLLFFFGVLQPPFPIPRVG